MSARHKLNAAFVTGSVVVAAVVGAIFQSWVVFILAAVVLIGAALHAGDVRFGKRRG